jgi:hypothetical protein
VDVDRARETIATERPRRLRLGELLYELGARAPDDHEVTDPPAALADGSGALPPPAAEPPRPETLTVGELVDRASEGGFGFLIGILTLIAIPFFGLSTPFGLAIALIGAQLAIGRSQPWLPRRARRRELSMAMLDRVATLLARRTRWLARSTRRRWEVLIMPRMIGLGVVLLALGLALPLPIPGSNLVFLIPLAIYAIGLLERDGLWILLAHVCLLVDVALMIIFAGAIWLVLQRIGGWLF